MTAFYGVLAFLIVQRLAELWLANRNTRRLLAEGAEEHGASHYPFFVVLHTTWIVAMAVTVPAEGDIDLWLLGAFAVLQLLRVWVIASLGRFWTTRIVTVPGAPLVRRGPYRLYRHPNYLVVMGEIAVVPLMAGLWEIAVVFSVLNFALILWRVRIEDLVLAERRAR
ncbi:MAG: isoprenylcysteine carboxyl methyltransferase family protein [Minwuia sp.]|uniref:isoprenylcysteine carboxyl methyltransferase family protein n=1 Tax=Minwuia sp. TaxID=2493630 RepID=UPI003A87FD64